MGETGRFFSWEIIDDITAIKNCDKWRTKTTYFNIQRR